MSLTKEDIKNLSAPFDEATLGVKVQSLSKQKDKAMLVAYLQHTDVYVRLEQVDPAWSSTVVHEERTSDMVYVRVRLTVNGVSRENVGDGEDPKMATSDAIKRAAMLFGVGRYLYDAETVWVPYNEQTDRFRTFTFTDYKNGLRKGQAKLPIGPAPTPPNAVAPPKSEQKLDRSTLAVEILKAAKAVNMTQPQLLQYVKEDYGKAVDKLTDDEMRSLLEALQIEQGRKGA